jgi:hypothetical protein
VQLAWHAERVGEAARRSMWSACACVSITALTRALRAREDLEVALDVAQRIDHHRLAACDRDPAQAPRAGRASWITVSPVSSATATTCNDRPRRSCRPRFTAS